MMTGYWPPSSETIYRFSNDPELNAEGWIGEHEGAKFWLSILTELQSRGVPDILIAAVDGLTGFPDAIASVYPKTEIQLCIVCLVRGSLKYVGWKERKAVARDLRAIYTSPMAKAAEATLDAFETLWSEHYSMAARGWRRGWEQIIPFFSYPAPIRKVIYTTNAIESLNAHYYVRGKAAGLR
jgi:putative transposase